MPPRAPEQTVYSYYPPEVQAVVEDVWTHDAGRLNRLLQQNYKPGLDHAHEKLMDRFEDHGRTSGVVGWDTFKYRYYTNGSSEGLFHLFAYHPNQPWSSLPAKRLYQLEGEYQGYSEYAKALDLHITSVSESQVLEDAYWHAHGARPHYQRGTFFVSNPSSRDGNILDEQVWKGIVNHHDVIVDLAYMGMTRPLNINLNHPNIKAVVASMSKPWGLYYFRSGFLWSREPVPSLYGNKWFKNIPSILVAEQVLEHVPAATLRGTYYQKQAEIIKRFEDPEHDLRPSDVWLLAYEDGGPESYVRANKRARYCLTPYYIDADDQRESAIGNTR